VAEPRTSGRISEENVALRRQFIGLTEQDVAVLAELAPWAARVAPELSKQTYDQQFAFAPTLSFYVAQARSSGRSLAELRAQLEAEQVTRFRAVFEEAARGGGYGAEFFEMRLGVGRAQDAMNLPLKWAVGGFAPHYARVRVALRHSFPHRPRFRAHAERAFVIVTNLEIQAMVEAFYYECFETMGVDLAAVRLENDDPAKDLSDYGDALKAMVRDTLGDVARVSSVLRDASKRMASTSEETGRATSEVAYAVVEFAGGVDRQVRMIAQARQSAEEVTDAVKVSTTVAAEASAAGMIARATATEGVESAELASRAMHSVRDSSRLIEGAIADLADKCEQIGQIVETISGIAEQTNLLALNAAIEAARAGEQGRGFAVVAAEVRTLAEGSRTAAGAITQIVLAIQDQTNRTVATAAAGATQFEDGAAVVERTGDAFVRIGQAVEDMTDRITQIGAAAEQIERSSDSMREAIIDVAAVAEQSSVSTEQVAASTQQTSVSAQEVAASAHGMEVTADELGALVGRLAFSA
jgi:methyl-accepting chemotaxis protein